MSDTSDDREWMDRAACRDADTALFFPDHGGVPPEAAALCRGCDVRPECLAYALRMGDDARGVWAGTGERMRRRMRSAARLRAGRKAPDHGTDAGYKQHERLGQKACVPCSDAHARYQQDNRPTRAKDAEAVGW